MNWTEQQQRFDELRERELVGLLSAQEYDELAVLIKLIEASEARYLAPALAHLAARQGEQEASLATQRARNEELAALVQQHEQLFNETRQWLR
jgi:hypothetical protein